MLSAFARISSTVQYETADNAAATPPCLSPHKAFSLSSPASFTTMPCFLASAIIRTAEAAGADGVIIPKRRSATVNPTVFKTSAGAAAWIKIARVSNLVDTIKTLKKHGVWVYGAEADGTPIDKADLSGALALVIGSEGFGLGKLVRENCDVVLSLPMFGKVNSLNASVCAGILMYEAVKYR